jgi:hypothetical protein
MYRHIVDTNRRIFSGIHRHINKRVLNGYCTGMVSAMDSAVGMVIRALKERHMLKNTLIVFLSDVMALKSSLNDKTMLNSEWRDSLLWREQLALTRRKSNVMGRWNPSTQLRVGRRTRSDRIQK